MPTPSEQVADACAAARERLQFLSPAWRAFNPETQDLLERARRALDDAANAAGDELADAARRPRPGLCRADGPHAAPPPAPPCAIEAVAGGPAPSVRPALRVGDVAVVLGAAGHKRRVRVDEVHGWGFRGRRYVACGHKQRLAADFDTVAAEDVVRVEDGRRSSRGGVA